MFLYLSFLFFQIEVQLIYNVVLISAEQQSDSVIHMHSFKKYPFPLRFIPGDCIQFLVLSSKTSLFIHSVPFGCAAGHVGS